MVDNVPMERDDVYEEIAMAFQCVQVTELNKALEASGITDVKLRKRICARFSSGMGNFLDQYWLKANGKRYYPLLCFTEKFLNTDTELTEVGTVYAPSASFAFHEYSGGDVEWYFSNAREDEPIEVGVVGQEEDLP